MPYRVTLLLAFTTDPKDRQNASPHSGGWSESFWSLASSPLATQLISKLAFLRAAMLPQECSVIGYRQQAFTLDKNRLLPGGTASGTVTYAGGYQGTINAPQDALMLNFSVSGQPNTTKHRLACMPDDSVGFGEYQPTTSFATALNTYIAYVVSIFSAVVRDFTQTPVRLLSISPPVAPATTGTITTNAGMAVAIGDWIRLHRVKDELGNPVTGTFYVGNIVINANNTVSYIVANGPNAIVVQPNGLVRKDVLVNMPLAGGVPSRLVSRKVGRPFVQYRGRRSKRPV